MCVCACTSTCPPICYLERVPDDDEIGPAKRVVESESPIGVQFLGQDFGEFGSIDLESDRFVALMNVEGLDHPTGQTLVRENAG